MAVKEVGYADDDVAVVVDVELPHSLWLPKPGRTEGEAQEYPRYRSGSATTAVNIAGFYIITLNMLA